MSNVMESNVIESNNIDNDYGQFILIHPDVEYDYNLPEVNFYNGKYNVSQTKLNCNTLNSYENTCKYNTYVNISKDGILYLFGCVIFSTLYTINCVYSIYRKA